MNLSFTIRSGPVEEPHLIRCSASWMIATQTENFLKKIWTHRDSVYKCKTFVEFNVKHYIHDRKPKQTRLNACANVRPHVESRPPISLYCCSVVHKKRRGGGGGDRWTGQTPGTSCYQSIKFVQKYFTTSLFL